MIFKSERIFVKPIHSENLKSEVRISKFETMSKSKI